MKVFVAGQSSDISYALKAQEILRRNVFEVTSSWAEKIQSGTSKQRMCDRMLEDIDDIYDSDAMVIVENRNFGGTGMWFEFGLAFETGIPIILVEPSYVCPYAFLTDVGYLRVHTAKSVQEAVNMLNDMREDYSSEH